MFGWIALFESTTRSRHKANLVNIRHTEINMSTDSIQKLFNQIGLILEYMQKRNIPTYCSLMLVKMDIYYVWIASTIMHKA